MISPRLSVSLLDDSAMNLLASRGVDLLEDENPPSLSRRLTAMKNHFTPLSGSELSSTKSKESKRRRFVKQDDYNEASVILVRNTVAWIKVDEEESSKQRIAFTGAIQLALMFVINRSDVELRKGLRVVELGSKERLSKKTMVDEKELSQFQKMWSLKKQDLEVKERLSKMKLLDSLIAKQEPLADYEEALKKKLIDELMTN
ncbi:hypothetical protein DY000_02042394 [Brassica cretica]|uniref:Uncharacterized protein n=1 Tax=Brassica cretica TaxID=69181 RepID=A0ABQ7B845_BRACR|nr:hypothetical protein DY000_02042394 [Brassica cretica]